MPAKSQDARLDTQTVRERQIAAAAHARSKKNTGAANQPNGSSSLKELALANQDAGLATSAGAGAGAGHSTGMSWNTASLDLLNTYRVAHNLANPAAFTSPYRQALLCNPGIGRQSPTMARRKEQRRVSKDQLALAVRKNFNGAAVSEIDVVVELVYKVRHQNKALRMRSAPSVTKKQQ